MSLRGERASDAPYVVCDLDTVGITISPAKAKTILIIEADTVLTGPLAFEAFGAVAGGHGQLVQVANSIQLVKLPPRNGPQSPRASSSAGA